MDQTRRDAAWQRIEAALTRLDAAARSRSDHHSDASMLELRLLEEQERHQALRSGLRDTLARIDALIGAQAPGKTPGEVGPA